MGVRYATKVRRAFRFAALSIILSALALIISLNIWPPRVLIALDTATPLRLDVQGACSVNFEVHDIAAHYGGDAGAPGGYGGPALAEVAFLADVQIGGRNVTRNKWVQIREDHSTYRFEPASSTGAGEDVLRVLRDPDSRMPCNVTLRVRPGTVLPSVTVRAWQPRWTEARVTTLILPSPFPYACLLRSLKHVSPPLL